MDFDATLDKNFIKIKEKLNRDQVKLWLPPFINESQDRNDYEFEKLAREFSQQLSLPKELCLRYLKQLQAKALNNIKERDSFRMTGQASLKVRVPNAHGGRIITISTELNKTGSALRENISAAISVPIDRLRIIFRGKFLQDELNLDIQGVKHGLHIMAIVLKENSNSMIPMYESHVQQLNSTKADIEMISKGHYFEVADQSGNMLKLPQAERKSLITAMTLHEKGRAALKKEDFAFALIMLLEAEKEFCQCNSSLLKSVDNYGVLSLDIVWCYLNLQSVTELPDAEERLRLCEESFQQSYGSNLERLAALKGFTGNESALFMRLHLLQAIVFYHQNKINEARELLKTAEQELKNLEVDDSLLCHLIELGYDTTEARLALRASMGDISTAVSIIENKKLEKKKIMEMEAQERKLRRKRKKLGKCLNGEWIEPQLHDTLMSMGFPYEVSKWALIRSNNDVNAAVNLIHENPQLPVGLSISKENSNHSSDASEKGATFGVVPEREKETGCDDTVEDLFTEATLLSGSESDSDCDSDDAGPSSRLKKKRDEAYMRLKEGLSNTEDDHLDVTLVTESAFLHKYKELILNM